MTQIVLLQPRVACSAFPLAPEFAREGYDETKTKEADQKNGGSSIK